MVDITVRGAGIFGLSVAWSCAKRGAKVRIIDPNGPGAGSSGGIVGALAPHVPDNWNPKKAFQLDSLLRAAQFWADVEDSGGVSAGYIRSGRIQPIVDTTALDIARRRTETARTFWSENATWTVEETVDDSWCPSSPTGWVIRDTLSAHLNPRKACDALVAALAAMGVAIEQNGPDIGKVLWATGVEGLMQLNEGKARIVGSGVKGQAALLRFDARGAAQILADSVYIIPHTDGAVAVGSTSERDYENPTTNDAQIDQIIEKARRIVPALRDAPVVQKWAGVRPRSRTRAPILGPWPERPGHFIANGGFKIGFGMAPKIAVVMADLLLEGRDNIPKGFEVSASF